jgi:predicted  nucleic acid-binding Zn-ribbon protein
MHSVTSSLRELAEVESPGRNSKTLSTEEKLKRILKLRQLIPESVCGHYDRFVKAGKVPIVAVRNGVCQGCFVRLSSGAFQQLIRQDDLNLCENCGRYIYPQEAVDEAAAATETKAPRPRRARVAKVA